MSLDNDVLMRIGARAEDLHREIERGKKGMEKLTAALKESKEEGKKTTKELTDGMKQATKALEQSQREVQKLKDSFKDYGDTKKQLREMNAELEKLRASGANVGRETAEGLGPLGQRIVSITGGIVSATSALMLLKRVAEDAQEKSRESGQRIVDEASGRRALAQITSDDSEFGRMVGNVEKIRKRTGATAAEAYQTVFNAESAGLGDDAQFFGKLRLINFDPSTAVNAVQKLQSAFGGASGAGTPMEIIEKILAAAKRSPVQAQDMAKATSVASVPFGGIGGSDEELLATISRLSEPFKTPEAAGEVIKSLSDQLYKKKRQIRFGPGEENLGGLDLISALPRLADEGKLRDESGKHRLDVTKFLGEANAIIGMRQIIADRDIINQRMAEVNQAQATAHDQDSELRRKYRLVGRDPALRAVTVAESQKQGKQLEEERRYGVANKLADAIQDQVLSAMEKDGQGRFAIWLQKQNMNFSRMVLGDPYYADAVNTNRFTSIGGTRVQFSDELVQALREFSASVEKMGAHINKLGSDVNQPKNGPTLLPPNQETGRGGPGIQTIR